MTPIQNKYVADLGSCGLRDIRLRAHLTQQQVGERLGISQKRISEIEKADMYMLKMDTVRRYLSAVGGNLRIMSEFND